MIINDG